MADDEKRKTFTLHFEYGDVEVIVDERLHHDEAYVMQLEDWTLKEVAAGYAVKIQGLGNG